MPTESMPMETGSAAFTPFSKDANTLPPHKKMRPL
jgi:hypothetical protein